MRRTYSRRQSWLISIAINALMWACVVLALVACSGSGNDANDYAAKLRAQEVQPAATHTPTQMGASPQPSETPDFGLQTLETIPTQTPAVVYVAQPVTVTQVVYVFIPDVEPYCVKGCDRP